MHYAPIPAITALALICGCAANTKFAIVERCPAEPFPVWAGLPLAPGHHPDTTLQAGTGGIALRAIDGGTGRQIDGGHLSMTQDTLLLTRTPRELSAISDGGRAAVIRNVRPGHYWLVYQRIGYQPFATEATVTTGRVDILSVTLYYVAICLSSNSFRPFPNGYRHTLRLGV